MMIKKFAETLESDPDKYFNGSYDWYFTGGSMDIVDVDGQEYVVHSEGNELQNLSECYNPRYVVFFSFQKVYLSSCHMIKTLLIILIFVELKQKTKTDKMQNIFGSN